MDAQMESRICECIFSQTIFIFIRSMLLLGGAWRPLYKAFGLILPSSEAEVDYFSMKNFKLNCDCNLHPKVRD